jgi:hypothetical protein
MTFGREDLKQLRLPLVLVSALVLVGAACLVTSEYLLDAARKTGEEARQSRVSAQGRVSKVAEEERGIRENLVYYDRMRRSGLISDQNRLDWIESVARIKNERKLFEIKYSIDAQKPLDYPGIVASGAAQFIVSRIKLDMLLLHEEDLLNFLADLDASGKVYMSVRHCTVTRVSREAQSAAATMQPRLGAECQIDVIALKGARPA